MKISLNAYRINQTDTTVFISFSAIKNDGFKLVESTRISNSKGELGVIFHIQNKSQSRINNPGNDTISFKHDFALETKAIRVFYWNDGGILSENLSCFQDFLEKNGLNPDVPVGDFDCENSTNKTILIPRQSGNGGVIGITDLP